MDSKNKNLVGVTGEYIVCVELGKLGGLALLTLKNNPLFNIVAVSPELQELLQFKSRLV